MSSSKQHVAFLGLGLMGRPMADQLVRRGYIVHVYNRTKAKAEKMREEMGSDHVIVEKTPHNAISAAAEYVVIMMFGYASLCSTLLESDETRLALKDKTVVQMMTIATDESLEAAAAIEKCGARYVESPVLGGNDAAAEAKLKVLVGLNEEQWKQYNEEGYDLEQVLTSFGTVHRFGEVPRAMQIKLDLNMVLITANAAFSNCVAMVDRQGNDAEKFMDMIRGTPFHAKFMDHVLPTAMKREYSDATFSIDGLLKDITLIRREARAQGVYDGILSSMVDMVKETKERVGGDQDFATIYEVMNPRKDDKK